jgi:hypothetical protein
VQGEEELWPSTKNYEFSQALHCRSLKQGFNLNANVFIFVEPSEIFDFCVKKLEKFLKFFFFFSFFSYILLFFSFTQIILWCHHALAIICVYVRFFVSVISRFVSLCSCTLFNLDCTLLCNTIDSELINWWKHELN